MNLSKLTNLAVLTLAISLAATGCKSKKPENLTVLPKPMAAPVEDTTAMPNTRGNPNPDNTSRRNVPQDTSLPPSNPLNNQSPISSTPNNTSPISTNPNPITPVDQNSQNHPPNEYGHPGWTGDYTPLQAQTVYFDFDKSTVKSGEMVKVTAVADYLKANPEKALRIEGNCDERGTEEYNRALGERRALATRELIINLGIDPGRLDTVTYGEDRPADPAHNEAAWSKNRRDDFVVLSPPKP